MEMRKVDNHDEVIRNAAIAEGMSYPLDDETLDFSRSVMRAMDDAMAWIHGDETKMKSGLKEYLMKMQEEAERL